MMYTKDFLEQKEAPYDLVDLTSHHEDKISSEQNDFSPLNNLKRKKSEDKDDQEFSFTECGIKEKWNFFLSSIPELGSVLNESCLSFSDVLSGEFFGGLLTNYMVDIDWMVQKCPRLESVSWTLVHGERDAKELERQCMSYPNVKLHKPPLPISYGTHHTKMAILFYEAGVRIAIMTNNFIDIDWQGKSQGIWVQDFPLKSECKEPTVFEQDLIDYIFKLGGPAAPYCRDLRLYDFSSANVVLVPSVPGYHKNKNLHRYGHMKLRHELSHEHISERYQDAPVIAQCSSLGSLNESWIQGELMRSMTSRRRQDSPQIQDSKPASLTPAFQFIWPTVEDVRNSMMGYASGGSIPGSIKNVFGSVDNAKQNKPKPFLAGYLHKWKGEPNSHRGNAMPHIKTYLRYFLTEQNQAEYLWVLLTSCNLSKAAWGSLQKNNTQLMIRSYEMGVLFTKSKKRETLQRKFSCTPEHPILGNATTAQISTKKEKVDENLTDISFVNAFSPSNNGNSAKALFPIPYQIPPARYEPADWPWAWDRPYEDPDIFGQKWQC